MFLILAVVFWLTIEGANVPSGLIANLLVDILHPILKNFASSFMPWWLSGVLIDGAYLAMAWVISVMLPPVSYTHLDVYKRQAYCSCSQIVGKISR